MIMDLREAVKIINFDTEDFPTEEESNKAYEVFFKSFGVNLQNKDGTYKSIYNIFSEANHNLRERLEKQESDKRNKIVKLANEITGEHFYKNQLEIVGAKIIGNRMYVKGYNGGFPHALAYVQVDLDSKKITKYYDAYGCPANIVDGIFE